MAPCRSRPHPARTGRSPPTRTRRLVPGRGQGPTAPSRCASRPATRPPPSAPSSSPSSPRSPTDSGRPTSGRRRGGGRRRLRRRHRRAGPTGRGPGGPDPRPASGGKGQAMRSALIATDAELIAFVDADVTNFEPHFVTGLLEPLLVDDSVALVKGYYRRPLHGSPEGGGRVTELDGPAGDRPALPPPGLHRAAPGRRDRRPPVGPREVRAGRRLRRGAGPADRRGLGSTGWAPSPRSTSGSGSTGTGPSPSSGPRPPTSCRRRWPGPA